MGICVYHRYVELTSFVVKQVQNCSSFYVLVQDVRMPEYDRVRNYTPDFRYNRYAHDG